MPKAVGFPYGRTHAPCFLFSFCGDPYAHRAQQCPNPQTLPFPQCEGIAGFESRAQSDVSSLNGGKPESADDGNAVSRIPEYAFFFRHPTSREKNKNNGF
jgi:hypothetical protein